MSKLKATFDRVKALLEKYPKYRDSDSILVNAFWWIELKNQGIDFDRQLTKIFFDMLTDKKITPASGIERARRKVMEHNIHLRGKSYKQRKKKENDYKGEISNLR